jgi:NAD(P)H-dependent flavin oxidoreductase YrpB (nitropropane dioxygenase family)
MLSTRFTALVGCSVPIQQAGMGSHLGPGLAAAAANADGLRVLWPAGRLARETKRSMQDVTALLSRALKLEDLCVALSAYWHYLIRF